MSDQEAPRGLTSDATYQQLAQLPLPQFVFNTAALNVSASEVSAVLSFGPRPLMMLIMAPAAAKSFATAILNSIQDFETKTGTKVLTIEEVHARVQRGGVGD